MSFGDVGGPVTELIITCKTPEEGEVNIKRGDPVRLVGNYEIAPMNHLFREKIFGQAMAASNNNGEAIPIKVRGVCCFDIDKIKDYVCVMPQTQTCLKWDVKNNQADLLL